MRDSTINKCIVGVKTLVLFLVIAAVYDHFISQHSKLSQVLKTQNSANVYDATGDYMYSYKDILPPMMRHIKEKPWREWRNEQDPIFATEKKPNNYESVADCVIAKNEQLPETCSVVFNQNHSTPIVALVSYPGSGNTWSRFLIERSTGIFTGSVYNDKSLFEKGNFCGEFVTSWTYRTVAVKVHLSPKTIEEVSMSRISKVILLIRNPYKAVMSYMNYLHAGHTKHAGNSYLKGPEWEKFSKGQINAWRNLVPSWLKESKPTLIVKYEDLKADTEQTMSKINSFLGYSNKRLHCLKTNSEGAFHRKTSCNGTFNPFSKETQKLYDEKISALEQTLKEYGYGRLNYNISVLDCQN